MVPDNMSEASARTVHVKELTTCEINHPLVEDETKLTFELSSTYPLVEGETKLTFEFNLGICVALQDDNSIIK